MNDQQNDKIIESIQKTQRWTLASMGLTQFASLITTGLLVWKSFKKDKPSLAVRRMRIKAAMARLELELNHLETEAKHESELAEFEVGLKKKEGDFAKSPLGTINSSPKQVENLANSFISNLKNKGEEMINKGTKELEKNFPDQAKNLKDKVLK